MPFPLIAILVLLGFFEEVTAQNNTTTTAFPTIPPIPPIPPEPETTPRASCPNPGLTDGIREIFLDMHNRLRASVARGQTERNGHFGIAPPTHTMYKLRYDCNAESYAQQHVNTCDGRPQPAHGHPGYRENVNVLNRQSNFEGAAQWAMASWWGQMATYGIRTDMLFTEQMRRRNNRNIRKFSKMAWWSNTRVGCAIRNCGSFIFTSCMYAPGGNVPGQHIYHVGAVCAGCPATCENGLCPAP
ncbi:SCP-like protein [Ancylostoma caninum]|uniref:SCP-like protein n=1 Tax=Ancylostoma caninum TaxID=29170 RepID=A0A368G3X0_ANCCA|nr:SCP-like protein [Ancylostoma caninum]